MLKKVGIDPDLIKSGVAVINKEGKLIQLSYIDLPTLAEYIKEHSNDSFFVLEAGWLNKKSNWHGGKNTLVAQLIAKKVGENHATGKIIEQFLIHYNCKYRLIKQTTAKKTPEMFTKVTKLKITKSKQDLIDSFFLIAENFKSV